MLVCPEESEVQRMLRVPHAHGSMFERIEHVKLIRPHTMLRCTTQDLAQHRFCTLKAPLLQGGVRLTKEHWKVLRSWLHSTPSVIIQHFSIA